MASRIVFNTFLQQWKIEESSSDDTESPGSRRGARDLISLSRIVDIKRTERAERAALIRHAERLCASEKAHSNAVLERLRFSAQQGSPRSSRLPASPGWCPESALHGGMVLDESSPSFERKLLLGSQVAILACETSPSPVGSVDTLFSADTHTPSELRAISQLQSRTASPFTPTPPQTPATRWKSRLPVKSIGQGYNGCPLQPATDKVQEIAERLERFQKVHHPSPQPLVPNRRTTVIPASPFTAAVTNRRGPRRGTSLCPVKADSLPIKDYVQPLAGPVESLSFCLRQLTSEDWEKKMNGFKSVQSLARHHPQLLQTKLHDVCLILTQEVKNLRSVVACTAMETIAALHVHLGKAMDPVAERTGRALLLKLAQTTNTFIHQQANLALDALVNGCSPSRVMSALLNTGLSHLCAAVRGSTAQHLSQLAEVIGEDQILTAGKIFTERFITAISKMSVDAAPDVRRHGQKMLKELTQQREFMVLWNKVIPVKDRCPLDKVLKKLRQ